MNSAAHDIAQYLVTQGVLPDLGGHDRWSVHVGGEPTAPNDVVTLYDTPGLEPDTDRLDIFQPTLLVRVRATNYIQGHGKQDEIRAALMLTQPIETPSSVFEHCIPTTDIFSLGRDEENRYILVCNYRARRARKEA